MAGAFHPPLHSSFRRCVTDGDIFAYRIFTIMEHRLGGKAIGPRMAHDNADFLGTNGSGLEQIVCRPQCGNSTAGALDINKLHNPFDKIDKAYGIRSGEHWYTFDVNKDSIIVHYKELQNFNVKLQWDEAAKWFSYAKI